MNFTALDYQLQQFITPFFQGRDASHDIEHVIRVVALTDDLIQNSYPEDLSDLDRTKIRYLAKIVAWLHDVDDRKYHDPTVQAESRMREFLATLDIDQVDSLLLAIKYVSYSQQKKLFGDNPANWTDHLPAHLVVVRNFVSDADKIEALGHIGIERCLAYSRYKYPNETELFHIKHLIQHHDEKLKYLTDKYISTKIGQQVARQHQDIMDNIVKDLANKL